MALSTWSVVICSRAKVPGFRRAVLIRHLALDRERARLQIDRGGDPDDASLERLRRKCIHVHGHIAPGSDPWRELLGHFGGHLQRVELHETHDGRLRLDVLSERDEPFGHEALEGRPDDGVAKITFGEPQRRPLRLDVGPKLAGGRERLFARRKRRVVARLCVVEIRCRDEAAGREALRAIEALRGVGQLCGRADDFRHTLERRQIARLGRAVPRAGLRERGALRLDTVLRFLLIELDEHLALVHAIAQIAPQRRHPPRDLCAHDHFLSGGQRADDVHRATNIAHLGGLDADLAQSLLPGRRHAALFRAACGGYEGEEKGEACKQSGSPHSASLQDERNIVYGGRRATEECGT